MREPSQPGVAVNASRTPEESPPPFEASSDDAMQAGMPSARAGFRRALENRDFALFFVGQLGASMGNGMVQLALPFLVLQLTGSAFQLGVAYFFQFLPMFLFGILGGVFVDRADRRLTIVVVDTVRGAAFLSAGAIYYFGALTIEHIYAVIFLESTLANLYNPARAALIPNLVPENNLRAANSLNEITRHVGFLIGPSLGTVMVGFIGPAALMLVDGATFLISATTVFLIKWRQPPREQTQAESWWHSLQIVFMQIAEGLGAIARSRLLQVAVFLGIALNLLVAPIQVLLPLFVQNVKHEGPSYYGVLVVGLLIGLIAGTLSFPTLSHRLGLGRLAIGGILVLGVLICVVPWPPTILPPLAGMAIAGAVIGSLNVAQTTMLQAATTDEERGRVSATYFTSTLGIRPFSFLIVGALASGIDIRVMFVALGLLTLAVGVALSRMPEVRDAH